jgi:hypothetical protein
MNGAVDCYIDEKAPSIETVDCNYPPSPLRNKTVTVLTKIALPAVKQSTVFAKRGLPVTKQSTASAK